MVSSVFKYDLEAASKAQLMLPEGSEILHVGVQNEQIKMWVRVPQDKPESVVRVFKIYGTGHTIIGSNLKYLGTVHLNNGVFVFHIFEDLNG